MSPAEFHDFLSRFTHSDRHYEYAVTDRLPALRLRTWAGLATVTYSEGVRALVEQGSARWLVDLIASLQTKAIQKMGRECRQIWKLMKSENRGEAVLTLHSGNTDDLLLTKRIRSTNFPFPNDGTFKICVRLTSTESGPILNMTLLRES